MRYNKQELFALASQTSQNFDREGVIILKERQDSFFRRSEGSSVRWFRLRGNLLFYLKGPEPWYEPLGVIVLGNHQVSVQTQDENGHWPFQLVWENGVCYRMGTFLESERTLWLRAMASAPYENLTQRIFDLQQQLNDTRTTIDLKKYRTSNKIINDFNEVPLCELSLSCDNLLCNANGNPPSPFAAVFVLFKEKDICVRYGCTEVVEKCSNPTFSRTVMFRGSDGINSDVMIRILVYDVRETVTQTGVAMGSVTMRLSHIQEAQRLRVPLLTVENRTVGFVTINGWSLEPVHSATSPTHPPNPEKNSIDLTPKVLAHRRSQSLPPRMGLKLKYPTYSMLIRQNFLNPLQATYRFHSGLGGDITVHEALAEPSFCFTMPLQLVEIFLQREKELLETMLAFAEVRKYVAPRHVDIVGNHLSIMRLLQAAKLAQEHVSTHLSAMKDLQKARGKMLNHSIYFKPSIKKVLEIAEEPELAYVPINLHLQRTWVHNDTLNKTGFHDIITVGAFTDHSHTTLKPGGLIRLLKQSKDATYNAEMTANSNRLEAEFEKIRAMKNLKNILVAHMDSALLLLHNDLFQQMSKPMAGIRENVKMIQELWNVELTERALSKVGWNKKRIDEDSEVSNRADRVALAARLTAPGGIAHRSAVAAAAIATVAALSAPTIAHHADITATMDAVLNGTDGARTAAGVARNIAASHLMVNISAQAASKRAVTKSAPAIVNRVAFIKNKTFGRTFSGTDLRRTSERNSVDKNRGRSLSESDLRRILEYKSKNKTRGCARAHSENDLRITSENNSINTSDKTRAVSECDLQRNCIKNHQNLRCFSVKNHKNGEEYAKEKVDTEKQDANTAGTSQNNAVEQAASTSGISPGGTSKMMTKGQVASTSGLNAAGTSQDNDLGSVASTSGLSSDVTSKNSTIEQAASTSGSTTNGYDGGRTSSLSATESASSSTTSAQSSSRSNASGKGNRGKPRGRKNNRAPKPSKQARKDANNELIRAQGEKARGEKAQLAEAAQFERTVCMRVDFKSSNSLEQVSVTNLFVDKKEDKKKAKKNRRQPVLMESDPAVRYYNMNFFKQLSVTLQDIMRYLFSNLNLIILKGYCTPNEFEDSRIMMDLMVKLLDEVQKWTRMAHTAMRIDTESPAWAVEHSMVRTRRDICFSQALTAATAGVLSWATTTPGEMVVKFIETGLGPLLGFEGLLSLYAQEKTMWGDMVVAIEDLQAVVFKFVQVTSSTPIIPQVTGFRNSLIVEVPVSDSLYARFEKMESPPSFTVTAVFFNIGINDKASVAEALGDHRPQQHSNIDNFDRIFKYYLKYCQQFPQDPMEQLRVSSRSKPLEEVVENLRSAVYKRASKNVEVLQLAALATRLMHGIRFTSCKSAKDRTGMSVTLEQTTILSNEYHLADHERKSALDIMRSEGCRLENTMKNIGQRKYAFTKQQVKALPEEYRPPPGSYGAGATLT